MHRVHPEGRSNVVRHRGYLLNISKVRGIDIKETHPVQKRHQYSLPASPSGAPIVYPPLETVSVQMSLRPSFLVLAERNRLPMMRGDSAGAGVEFAWEVEPLS